MPRKTVLVCAALSCGATFSSALAQTAPRATPQEIQELQQQIRQLQDRLDSMSDKVQQQQNDISAVKNAQPQASAGGDEWKAGIFHGRPAIYSADGQNSIALVGRLQFDIGDYFQTGRPTPDARTKQDLNSGYNLRRGRLGVTGTLLGDWQYDFVTEFGNLTNANPGGQAAPANTPANAKVSTGSILTASLSYTGLKPLTFVIGYTDVDDSFAESVSSADITFNERPSISNLTTNIAGNEPRAAAGVRANGERWYAMAFGTGAQNVTAANDQQVGAAARAAFLPLKTESALLHVGVNGSYVFQPTQIQAQGAGGANTITLSDQPELRIDPTALISTGAIPFLHASTWGAELAGEWRNLWFDAEYQGIGIEQTKANNAAAPTPFLNFDGAYGEAGWFITGEQRPYSIGRGAWTTLRPLHPFSLKPGGGWGAWELALRYSHANLNSKVTGGLPAAATGGQFGGIQDISQIGLNWYPTANVRFLLDYLFTDVNRLATNGVTHVGQRFQAVAFRTQVNW